VKPTVVLILLLFLVGCGGNAASPAGNLVTPTPITGTPPPSATANVVTVAAGQTVGSVDVMVVAPASTPAPNAQDLGVASMTGGGSAFNTGDIIHRGQTARVLLFGPGLNGGMQLTIRGPGDIAIADLTSITSTTNTPGISFTAIASPTAALGARTVMLKNANGDITTFTGGLEVVP
jgi:Zn-dependent alcohol dehydrogenase